MSQAVIEAREEVEHYITSDYSLKSWLLTTDHKRIGLMYMVLITFFFFVGGAAATLIRLELMTPRGDLHPTPDAYNRQFTLHGIVMVFFFLIPSIPTVLGNFLVPLMLGARDLAFPKLNLLSWYIFMVGGVLTISVAVIGGVDTGWTFYAPVQQHVLEHLRHPRGGRHLHHGVLVDPDRPELHGDDPHDAGARA
jgi:cytochrome c oxidase subunit 1